MSLYIANVEAAIKQVQQERRRSKVKRSAIRNLFQQDEAGRIRIGIAGEILRHDAVILVLRGGFPVVDIGYFAVSSFERLKIIVATLKM